MPASDGEEVIRGTKLAKKSLSSQSLPICKNMKGIAMSIARIIEM
jgi:hypothetical protein